MEKTAVEWLVDEVKTLLKNGYTFNPQFEKEIIEQAKEIEKKNLYTFYIQGGIDCISEADRTVEQYYNEKFNKK